jgi:thermitase
VLFPLLHTYALPIFTGKSVIINRLKQHQMTSKKKLVVRFTEGASPTNLMAVANTGHQPRFEPLYKIENEMEGFASMNDDKAADKEKKLSNTFTVTCNSDEEASGLYAALQNDPSVDYVQYDELNSLYLQSNDPLWNELWGLIKIDCAPAWKISQGEDIIVAVIDTGVDYNHPDIRENIWTGPDGSHGFDFSNNTNDPLDYHGHGTHCAGTIAAITNNATGIAGVAPKAKIMALKIFPHAYDSVCAQAIKYAADNGAKIISNSWGPNDRRPQNPTLAEAIDYATAKGCIVVFAAGNNNDDVQFYSPANHPAVISVAATDRNDQRAGFSNFGPLVNIAAPGVDILSLKANSDGYVGMSGTSMACPHVSGLCALIVGNNMQYTSEKVKFLLQKNADVISTDKPVGAGRINAINTVNSADIPMVG